ncbi:MAG: type II secretion system protein [Acidimicrobiia bacterium]
MTKRTNRAQGDEGFTLIELLVVIVILGTLAAVVVFAVNGLTDRGTESACKADVKSVEVAMEAYNADEGSYPASINALAPKYLRSLPANPDYSISVAGTGTVSVTPLCDSFD